MKDLIKSFLDEIYSSPTRKIFPSNKLLYNHFDEICSIDLADMVDYKFLSSKGYRYIFKLLDNFSNHLWCLSLKIKTSQTIANEISNNLTKSKRRPIRLQSDREKEWYNSIFQSFF